MGQVNVQVNGRNYSVACNDGEEAHLEKLAAMVDKQVTDLVGEVGQIGDTRLLLMSNLLIADQLEDLSQGNGGNSDTSSRIAELEAQLKEAEARVETAETDLIAAAEKLEAVAEKLESA